ncbi:MAG: hypothetical protein ACTHL7_08775 [Steroidobacteraceae bacterium]
MPQPTAAWCLRRRAQRYQRWHEDPAVTARTSFFAAAAIVNRVLARYMLLSPFLLDLGTTLETLNTRRALEIRAGRLYRAGSIESNTLDFVQYEQSIVQAHLDGLRQSAPRSYRREIQSVNAALSGLRCGGARLFANRCFLKAADEARRSLGGRLDFAEQQCRVILGTQIARQAMLMSMPSTLDYTRAEDCYCGSCSDLAYSCHPSRQGLQDMVVRMRYNKCHAQPQRGSARGGHG